MLATKYRVLFGAIEEAAVGEANKVLADAVIFRWERETTNKTLFDKLDTNKSYEESSVKRPLVP